MTRITVRDVAEGWDVETIARALVDRLESQVNGKAPKTTQAARNRAGELRAVVALLGGRS